MTTNNSDQKSGENNISISDAIKCQDSLKKILILITAKPL